MRPVAFQPRAQAAPGCASNPLAHAIARISGLSAVAVGLAASPLSPQAPADPLTPLRASGDLVAPYFDGWYANADGSFTLSFGFMNRNTEEVVDIPLGPNNHIRPAEFDGVQPTHFTPVSYGGFSGRRERGTFAVTVPEDLADQDVVWTLAHAGQPHSVPGRVRSPAYELSRTPAGLGSLPPAIRFEGDGAVSMGREGIYAHPQTVRAHQGLILSVEVQDRGEQIPESRFRSRAPVGVHWVTHQGPGSVEFDAERQTIDAEGWGMARTMVTFREPGEYVLRVRADNFRAPDSGFDYQCCWSNAYLPVTVTP